MPPQEYAQVKLESSTQVHVAAVTLKAGVHLINTSKEVETYYLFNSFWIGYGTAGANFDHPEATFLKPGGGDLGPTARVLQGPRTEGKACSCDVD